MSSPPCVYLVVVRLAVGDRARVFKAFSTCAIVVALFATGIVLSSLLIAAYSRPFTGEISVKPELLQQVAPSPAAAK
jgi:hypothetical protein